MRMRRVEPIRFKNPPIVLSVLAPARQCNQRCPRCYLTEVVDEPVTRFQLDPSHYVRFIDEISAAGVPVAGVSFQGYEVTLPQSWPYLEAVFEAVRGKSMRKSFVTNGMLLHKYATRLAELNPDRISVSLDGATAEVNDRIRGLAGAFDATVSSLQRFLGEAPAFLDRVGVVSTLYDEENAASLRSMPKLLAGLGIRRWGLSFELALKGGVARPARDSATIKRWLDVLFESAEVEGIRGFANDEFRQFGGDVGRMKAHGIYDPDFLVRFDPRGFVRTGLEVLDVWDERRARRWVPGAGNILDVLDYPGKLRRWRDRQSSRRRRLGTVDHA